MGNFGDVTRGVARCGVGMWRLLRQIIDVVRLLLDRRVGGQDTSFS